MEHSLKESSATTHLDVDSGAVEVKIESDDRYTDNLENLEENINYNFGDTTTKEGSDDHDAVHSYQFFTDLGNKNSGDNRASFADPLEIDKPTPSDVSVHERKRILEKSDTTFQTQPPLVSLPNFSSKQQFTSEMKSSVTNIVNECVCVLHRDPRGYHPFYLRIHKFITVGKQLGFVKTEEEVDNLWNEYDLFAKQQFENWKRTGTLEFKEEHSPYLTFLLTKKIIWQGKLVKVQGNQKKRLKILKTLEYLGLKHRRDCLKSGVTEMEIREKLKYRLMFFEQVKHITFPADMPSMNKTWNNLLEGIKVRSGKNRSANVTENNLEEVEVKRSRRERKAPTRFETEISSVNVSSESKSDIQISSKKSPSVKHNFKSDKEKRTYWAEWQRKRRANRTFEEREQDCKRMLLNYYKKMGKIVPKELEGYNKKKTKNKDNQRCKTVGEKKQHCKESPCQDEKYEKEGQVLHGNNTTGKMIVEGESHQVKGEEDDDESSGTSVKQEKKEGSSVRPRRQSVSSSLDDETVKKTKSVMLKHLSAVEKRQYRKEWARIRRKNMTEEEKEEESRKMRERHRKRMHNMTPDEVEDYKQRLKFQRLERRLEFETLSEDEQIRRKTLNFVKTQSWLANKDKEWKAKYYEKQRQQARERRAKMTPEDKERQRDNYRRYIANLSGDKLERHKQNVRKSVRRYLDKLKREKPLDWYNKTTGWQRERWTKWLDYQRERTKNETPQQRENRLLRYRINQAKKRTRTQLEKEGLSSEEIENRLKEVEEQLRSAPKPVCSTYRPRLGARKAHKVQNPRLPPDQWVNGKPPEYTTVAATNWNTASSSSSVNTPLLESVKTKIMPPILHVSENIEQVPQHQTTFIPIRTATTFLHSEPSLAQFESPPTLILVQNAVVISTPTISITPRNTINSAAPEESFVETNFEQLGPNNPVHDEVEEAFFFDDDGNEIEDVISADISSSQEENKTVEMSIQDDPLSETGNPSPLILSDLPKASILSSTSNQTLIFSVPTPSNQNVSLSIGELIVVPTSVASVSICSSAVGQLENSLGSKVEPPEAFVSCPPSRQAAICDECGKTFTTQFSVQLHKNVVHALDPSVLLCPKCQYPCSSTASLWNHFSTHHLEDVDALPEEYFPKKSVIRVPRPPNEPYKQQRSNPDGHPFSCNLCGKQFVQKCTMDDHIRRYHEGKGHHCEVCGKDQQSAAKLWRHKVERHDMTDLPPPKGVPAVKCRYCNEIVMRGYEQHVKKKHAEQHADFLTWYNPAEGTAPRGNSNESVQCPYCPSIVRSKLLNRHIKFMHTARTKFPCPECGFEFKRQDHMKKHYREYHTVADIEKKLEAKQLVKVNNRRHFAATCLLCQTEITSKIVLRAHFVAEHHEIFQQCQVASSAIFECAFCSEKFSKESQRHSHVQITHPDQLFTCQHCGIFKYSQTELTAHERQHRKTEMESRRQFGVCDLCDFNARDALMFKGESEEYNENEIGGKKPTPRYQIMLYEHVKTHHPERFLPCPNPGCLKFTLSQEDFKNHMIRCQKNGSLNTREFIDKTVSKLVVICPECQGPVRLAMLDKHLAKAHGMEDKREYPCPHCVPRTFQDRRYYVAHMRLIHKVSLEHLLDLAPPDAKTVRVKRTKKEKMEKPKSSKKMAKVVAKQQPSKIVERKRARFSNHVVEGSGSESEQDWTEDMCDENEGFDATPSRKSSRIRAKARVVKAKRKKVGPKSKTQRIFREEKTEESVPDNTTVKKRGRKPIKPTIHYNNRIEGNMDVEKKKRLVVSITRIPEDTVKFYLARHVIKVEY